MLLSVEFIDVDEFPDHIKDLLKHMDEQSEATRLQKEFERSLCKIKIYCHRDQILQKMLQVNKDLSVQEATTIAYNVSNRIVTLEFFQKDYKGYSLESK